MVKRILQMIITAVIMTAGAQPSWAQSTPADNSNAAIETLLAKCGELSAQYEATLAKYGEARAEVDSLSADNAQLKQELEAAHKKVGEISGDLERSRAMSAQLKAVAGHRDQSAERIREGLLRSAGQRIGELEAQLAQLKTQKEQGESRITEAYASAGMPPLFLQKVDYKENVWDRPIAVPKFPAVAAYGSVICTPSNSSRGLKARGEEQQSRDAVSRCLAIKAAVEKGGRKMIIAPAMEGGSAAFLMFIASGLPSYKTRELEQATYRNTGMITAAFERIEALEMKTARHDAELSDHETRIRGLEETANYGADLVPGAALYATNSGFAGLDTLRLELPMADDTDLGLGAGAGANLDQQFAWLLQADLTHHLGDWSIGLQAGDFCQKETASPGAGDHTINAGLRISRDLGPVAIDLTVGGGAHFRVAHDQPIIGWVAGLGLAVPLFR